MTILRDSEKVRLSGDTRPGGPIAVASWAETANANNAAATATRSAPSDGQKHYIIGVSGSFSATASGALLTLKDGTTEVARWYVYDSFALTFPSPIEMTAETAANLELAASGEADVVGAVNLVGYTL